MKKDIRGTLDSYPNVRAMLDGIAKELWYVFLPDTENGMAMLEADILAQRKRDKERRKVMALQKLCGFKLRPNESLRDVIVRAKNEGLADDKSQRDY